MAWSDRWYSNHNVRTDQNGYICSWGQKKKSAEKIQMKIII